MDGPVDTDSGEAAAPSGDDSGEAAGPSGEVGSDASCDGCAAAVADGDERAAKLNDRMFGIGDGGTSSSLS